MLMRAKIVFGLAASVVLAAIAACVGAGGEGDRCNPDLSHDECGGGLVCTQPGACPEAYCCPANASTSSNPYCRADPSVCPSEAGASGDAAPDADGAATDAPTE